VPGHGGWFHPLQNVQEDTAEMPLKSTSSGVVNPPTALSLTVVSH
jgi:hypothetical protein